MTIKNEEKESDAEVKKRTARKRNLKINIAKEILDKNIDMVHSFSKVELKKMFNMKESDFVYIVKELFDKKKDSYQIKDEFAIFLDKVLKSNKLVQEVLGPAEALFLKTFGRFRKKIENDWWSIDFYSYKLMYDSLKAVIPVIHWVRLPLFNNDLIVNRGVEAEINTLDFYNHIDCLEVLMNEILGQGIVLSNKGDLTLNKEMLFKVYNRRYGHYDIYHISRTIDGWFCCFNSINGKCKKEGEGALFDNLDHDSIFFPEEGVKHAMKILWEEADEGTIGFEELSKKMQEIADWISNVEKAVGTQPKWINYY